MSEEINYKTDVAKGWVLINFSDTCESISLNGIKIKQKQYQQKGKYPVVDQGQELIGGYYDKDELVVSGEPPFIIFGDHTKVKKLVNFKFIAGADGVKVLKPYEFLNPKLFFHFMHCIKLPDKGYARHYQFLGKAEFPIPPLLEQHRIVSKIEELFSSLDKGNESLKTAQEQLKVYRQAVLKWAFEGKLSDSFRKDNPYFNSYIEDKHHLIEEYNSKKEGQDIPRRLPPVSFDELFDLPFGWIWVESHKICSSVRDGTHDTPKYFESGIPLITSKNLKNGSLDFENVDFISFEDHIEISKRSAVETGDILYGMIGTIGNPVIISTNNTFSIKNVGLFKRNEDLIVPTYLKYWLESWVCDKILKELDLIKGTTQKFIALGGLRILPVPLPSKEEQLFIVSEIESRLSVCDKIEESITTSLQQAEALRQSILKKAFEGKLVAQDPNDEPASVLLERIKAEMEKNKPAKKVKEKKVKQTKSKKTVTA